MTRDSFTDLPPASMRTTHTRQAEAACASGTERDDGSSVPEGAGWRDAMDRIDDALLDLTICEGIGSICIGFSVALFTLGETGGYIGSAFFAAMTILMLSFNRLSRRDIRAEISELAKQKKNQPSLNPRRDPVSRRDTGECAADGTRYDYVPSAATYSLDNEPMINVVPWRGK